MERKLQVSFNVPSALLLLLTILSLTFATVPATVAKDFGLYHCITDSPLYCSGQDQYKHINDIHAEVGLVASSRGTTLPNNAYLSQNTPVDLGYSGKGIWESNGNPILYLLDSRYTALGAYKLPKNMPFLPELPDSSLVSLVNVPIYTECDGIVPSAFIRIKATGMLVCKNTASVKKDASTIVGPRQPASNSPSTYWSGTYQDTFTSETIYSANYALPDCVLYAKLDPTDGHFVQPCSTANSGYCSIQQKYTDSCGRDMTQNLYLIYLSSGGLNIDIAEPIHLNLFIDNPPAAIFSCKSKNNAAITNDFAVAEPTRCDGTPSNDPDTGNTIIGYQWTPNPAGPTIATPTGSITDVTYSNSNPTPYHLTLTVTSSYPASPNGLTDSAFNDYIVHNAACAATYAAGSTLFGANAIHDTYTVAYSYTYPIVGAAATELALTCAGDSAGTVESKSCAPNADNRAGTCTVVCKYNSPAIDNRKADPVVISVGGRSVNCNTAGAKAPPINNTLPVAIFNCTSSISQTRVNNFAFHEPITCNGAPSYDIQPPSQTITTYDWANPNCIPATKHVLAPITVESGLDCSPPTGTTPISLVVTSTDGGVSPPTIHPYTFVDGTCGVVYDAMAATGGKIRDTYNVSYQYVYPIVEAADLAPITCSSRGGVAGTVDAASKSCTPNAADNRFGKCRFTCVYNSLRIANRTAAVKLTAGRQISCGTGNSTNLFEPIDVTFFCYSNLDNSRRNNFAINENITCDSTGTNDPNPGYNITNYTWDPGDPIAPVTPDGPNINVTYVCNPADNKLVMLAANSTSGDSGSTSRTYAVKSPDCRIIPTGSDMGVITDNYRVDYHFAYPPVLPNNGMRVDGCNAAGGALGIGRVNSCTPDSGDSRSGACEVTCTYPPGTTGRTIGATLTVTGIGGGCTISVACAAPAGTAPEPTACFGVV